MFYVDLKDFMIADDEYINDNVIYCKYCKTPRIVKVDEEHVVRCACSCQSQKYDEQVEKEKLQRKMERLRQLQQNSLLGRRYQNSSFEKLDLKRPDSFVKAVERCKNFCENWRAVEERGLGIYLYGNSGTGKTELTACICNNLLQRYVTVAITSFIEVSKRLRASFKTWSTETEEEIIEKFAGVDLLILDDVGTEKLMKDDNTESFMQERIYDIINRRYINLKPTIFSSNYSINELMSERGVMQKIVDRINEMSQAVIHLDGTSYRQKKVENEEKLF